MRMKLDKYFTLSEQIDSKWIKDSNVGAKTRQYLGGNIGDNFHNLGFGNGFLDMSPKAQQRRKK